MDRRIVGLAVGACLVLSGGLRADEPLPAPRILEVALPAVPAYGYYRTSRWDVWQNYAVDRSGHFRPLVIYGPYGAYYRYNGSPYPWASTHQLDFAPRVVGAPYRDYMPYLTD